MSASRRTEVRTLVGVAWGPRPRLRTGAPSMSSVHAGLSESMTLTEVFFGNLAVVASFVIVLSYVFTRDGEVVPDCIASNEVKPVISDIQLALWFVPCEHV